MVPVCNFGVRTDPSCSFLEEDPSLAVSLNVRLIWKLECPEGLERGMLTSLASARILGQVAARSPAYEKLRHADESIVLGKPKIQREIEIANGER